MDKPRKIRISKEVREKRGYGELAPIADQFQGRSDSFMIGSVPHHQMLAYGNAVGVANVHRASAMDNPHARHEYREAAGKANKARKKMTPGNPKEVKGPVNPSSVKPASN